MKLKSFFLLILSVTTISPLVDIRAALAQCNWWWSCNDKYRFGSTTGGPILPPSQIQRSNEMITQGKATVGDFMAIAYDSAQKQDFATSETRYRQALELAEKTQDLDAQAAAHQGLGGVYTKIGKSNLGSSHLRNAGTLYRKSGNSQRSNEVRQQLRQIEFQQIKVKPVMGN
jgi:hypothetical protein